MLGKKLPLELVGGEWFADQPTLRRPTRSSHERRHYSDRATMQAVTLSVCTSCTPDAAGPLDLDVASTLPSTT